MDYQTLPDPLPTNKKKYLSVAYNNTDLFPSQETDIIVPLLTNTLYLIFKISLQGFPLMG